MSQQGVSPKKPARKKRILVADESITVQKLVHLSLASTSFEVLTASDGPDALTKLKSLKPDVALIDLNLRQIDGPDLIEKIRADPQLSPMVVIALKGNLSKEKELKLAGLVLDDVLPKPFDARHLMDLVHKHAFDEESTAVRPDEIAISDDEKTPVVRGESTVPKKIQKVEALNSKLEAIAAEIKGSISTSETDEITQKVSPSQFKIPVNDDKAHLTETAKPPVDLEAVARNEIQSWIRENLPRILESAVKEEIARLSRNQK